MYTLFDTLQLLDAFMCYSEHSFYSEGPRVLILPRAPKIAGPALILGDWSLTIDQSSSSSSPRLQLWRARTP
jgi:hypothetical protein